MKRNAERGLRVPPTRKFAATSFQTRLLDPYFWLREPKFWLAAGSVLLDKGLEYQSADRFLCRGAKEFISNWSQLIHNTHSRSDLLPTARASPSMHLPDEIKNNSKNTRIFFELFPSPLPLHTCTHTTSRGPNLCDLDASRRHLRDVHVPQHLILPDHRPLVGGLALEAELGEEPLIILKGRVVRRQKLSMGKSGKRVNACYRYLRALFY